MWKIKDFILSLQLIFKTRYWHMNECYSKEWDKELKRRLSMYDFENIGKFTADLGGLTLWVANYPYSSFMPYDKNGTDKRKSSVRASRLTIMRAKEKLDEAMVKQFGRVKTREEFEKEAIEELRKHKERAEEIQQKINELRESIRLSPLNVSNYDNKKSLMNKTKVRKHTFKYG